ncbi:hypothetical protein [Zhihengliuella sp.]|uniref:hypothetical protein n=1 Tax=Zhihengliuella sp. TaxID=1954483 RepID=UPI00281110B6|nr:hypothetical protein [Zhihengliuella sp.]
MSHPEQTTQPPSAPTGAKPRTRAGRGLGITALVVALVAICLSALPIINNVAAVLGVIALGLGIASLVMASRRNGGKGFGIASTVIAVMAIVVVFATQAFYVSVLDGAEDAVDQTIEQAETGERAATEEEQSAAAATEANQLGTAAAVGDYQVTVDAVNLDAGEDIAAVNELNEPATGQHVLVDLTVAYEGTEEGTPWLDLTAELVGSDARIYSSSTCTAVLERNGIEQPNLTAGGTSSYQTCFDVPAEAIEGAMLRVGATFDVNGEPAVWNVQ